MAGLMILSRLDYSRFAKVMKEIVQNKAITPRYIASVLALILLMSCVICIVEWLPSVLRRNNFSFTHAVSDS